VPNLTNNFAAKRSSLSVPPPPLRSLSFAHHTHARPRTFPTLDDDRYWPARCAVTATPLLALSPPDSELLVVELHCLAVLVVQSRAFRCLCVSRERAPTHTHTHTFGLRPRSPSVSRTAPCASHHGWRWRRSRPPISHSAIAVVAGACVRCACSCARVPAERQPPSLLHHRLS